MYNKESLKKLLDLIEKIIDDKENAWFRNDLGERVFPEINFSGDHLEEIYEHCLRKILEDHGKNFYADFRLEDIKKGLTDDFIRMEKFRREDNFEEFCLAVFQQIERVVNSLADDNIKQVFLTNKGEISHKIKNKKTEVYERQELWKLIFFPSMNEVELNKKCEKTIGEWTFQERYKLILYYYYFNQKIYSYHDFLTKSLLLDELYQMRNLNHRGGNTTEKQKNTIQKVKSNEHKYYFKFLGFLEDFISTVNKHI
jgi:hypothetical protein